MLPCLAIEITQKQAQQITCMSTLIARHVHERRTQSFELIDLQQPTEKNPNKTFQPCAMLVCYLVTDSYKHQHVFVSIVLTKG